MFFWNSLAFLMIRWMLAIWSLVPLPFQNPAWTSGSSWFKYYWSLSESEVAQSCPTLCDPVDCSLPGPSVHGIFQGRILEWVAIFFSRRSSWPRDWTQVSLIVGRHFTIWATVVPIVTEFSEPLGTPLVYLIYLVLLGYLLVILALSETKERTYPGHTTSK